MNWNSVYVNWENNTILWHRQRWKLLLFGEVLNIKNRMIGLDRPPSYFQTILGKAYYPKTTNCIVYQWTFPQSALIFSWWSTKTPAWEGGNRLARVGLKGAVWLACAFRSRSYQVNLESCNPVLSQEGCKHHKINNKIPISNFYFVHLPGVRFFNSIVCVNLENSYVFRFTNCTKMVTTRHSFSS